MRRPAPPDGGGECARLHGHLRAPHAGWSLGGGTHRASRLLDEWESILRQTPQRIASRLLDPGEHGRDLRKVTPFAGVLDQRRRLAIYRAFGAAAWCLEAHDLWLSKVAAMRPDRCRDVTGIVLGMESTVDAVGRVVVPKPLRDALGLVPGTTVDISLYGTGLQLLPGGRTARLVEVEGTLVADAETVVTDDDVLALIDAGRR